MQRPRALLDADRTEPDRGVSTVIGFTLIFGFLVIAFSLYQGVDVPQQNKEAEFNHNQRVQGELLSLNDAVLRTATTGIGQTVRITVGADYPRRAIAVNFAVTGGRVVTEKADQQDSTITFNNTVATTSTTSGREIADYWNDSRSDLNFSTKDIVYRPIYTRYNNAPDTVLSNTAVFNQFDNTNLSISDQFIIQDQRITIITIDGNLTKAKTGEGASVSIETEPISVAENTIQITNRTAGVMNITVPTTITSVEAWNDSSLQSQIKDEGHVRDTVLNDHNLTIMLEPGTYTLRMAKIGVGTDTTNEGAEYITPIDTPQPTLSNESNYTVTLEVRDRFNNPNSSTIVNATASGTNGGANFSTDDGALEPGLEKETNAAGEVTFTFRTPDADGEITLHFNISDSPVTAASTADRKYVNLTFDVNKASAGSGGGGVSNTSDASNQVVFEGVSFTDGGDQLTYDFNNTGDEDLKLTAIRLGFAVQFETSTGGGGPPGGGGGGQGQSLEINDGPSEITDVDGQTVSAVEQKAPAELNSDITLPTGQITSIPITLDSTYTTSGKDALHISITLYFKDGLKAEYTLYVGV